MAIKRKGWSPRPCDVDASAAWTMIFHVREAMPWYLALWRGRRQVRGQWAKDFFWAWICDFRSKSALSESKWPDQLWYLRAFKAEGRYWDRGGLEARRS